MKEIQPGWWRTLLKDTTTKLYARVDIIKRGDGELAIVLNVNELATQIEIVFSEGVVAITGYRIKGKTKKEVWKDAMMFDGQFVWKEEDNSNT